MVQQEFIDRFYFEHGPCCAGCDWWCSLNSLVGECRAAKIVSGDERADMLGIEESSLRIPAGHPLTNRDHHCGSFKDDFDWSSLTAAYLKRIGAPLAKPERT